MCLFNHFKLLQLLSTWFRHCRSGFTYTVITSSCTNSSYLSIASPDISSGPDRLLLDTQAPYLPTDYSSFFYSSFGNIICCDQRGLFCLTHKPASKMRNNRKEQIRKSHKHSVNVNTSRLYFL